MFLRAMSSATPSLETTMRIVRTISFLGSTGAGLREFKEIHDFVRHMIQFRKEHPILRKMTKPSSCQFPEISVHNGTPFNASTDYKTKLIGIMYAGRNEEDTEG